MHAQTYKSMALTHLLVGAALLSLACFFSGSEAGTVGVCYGMMASKLIKPPAVVQLLKRNGITMVHLYDANPEALTALANTNIKVGVSLPNQYLALAAGSTLYALQWVQSNVKAYPGTKINHVAVGNEVFHQQPELTPQLLPAMKNIQAALVSVGLADAVKVVTPIALDALTKSFPPSEGQFRDDIAQSVMRPLIDFLDRTGSHLTFNYYPYLAYRDHPDQINLDYVLFRPNKGQLDKGTGLMYYNMFDAMVDAVFHAVEKLSSSSEHGRGRILSGSDSSASFIESGSANGGGTTGPAAADNLGEQKSVSAAATPANAQTYNNNLISKILRGTGTPYKPNAVISGYIFSLFNEDLKPGDDDERSFGLFYPNGTPVYKVDFVNPGPAPATPTPTPAGSSWCTANAAVSDKQLQDALDYACANGADCSAIQPGKTCYQPNTVVAHASYAFNDFYQRKSGTCDFNGAASIVYQKPTGTCDASAPAAASWCVANTAVGDTRLQAALDYACSNGADCSAIQRGGRCFDPDTKEVHASYAFNDYYKRNGRTEQSCNFDGCGSVVHQQPKYGNCVL
ncbi:glucan endo-1,3-beta-glucosidase GII [Aegilops tauschii subsp. strangulata]|uniref:X8 domain-containing protein n=2 Tax=Aegilops tauschii subsp. strangulata TaxID=200361 RepID=A0A453T8L1_AEGTS|nr:glucan endo-1,3-beta-D-glucosidase [Aegilops tauschii subsp. strangulata]